MEINTVNIEAISPRDMRYRTSGDWVLDAESGELLVRVVDTGDWRYNMLLAVHELIEVILCANAEISQEVVDKFDFAHQEDEDPGSHLASPYHNQHMTAFGIEMILSAALGVKWRLYENCVDAAFRKTPKCTKPSES